MDPSPAPSTSSTVSKKSSSSKAVVEFKRPFEVSSRKRKVLSEDKFAEALEKIIQRECFPDLEKLKAQNAYLDAVANNDIQMMRELTTKYGVGRNTPSIQREANETPSTFETPSSIILSALHKEPELDGSTPNVLLGQPEELTSGSQPDDDAKSVTSEVSNRTSKGGRLPHELGLNEFLNTYTSEDNKSFQEIVEEGIRKHQIKNSWLFKPEDIHDKIMRHALAPPSAEEQQSLEYQRPTNVATWTYKNKNAIMYIPDGVPYTTQELAEQAKKKPIVDFKRTRFSQKLYKGDDKQIVDGKPMNLIHGFMEGKIGVDGREETYNKTPSVGGFKFVRTPSPTPGVEESPFLTWGEIEGTPFRLDAGDTPVPSTVGSPFRMMESSKRERIAFELAEKVSKNYRDKKQKTIEVAKSYLASPSPRPKTSVERMNSMSPAAQRFARSLLKKSEPCTPRTPR